MTTSHHAKMLNQIKDKPGKYRKYLKHNVPKQRKFGKNAKRCVLTGSTRGVINKYGLRICRQSFRQHAEELGFKQYR